MIPYNLYLFSILKIFCYYSISQKVAYAFENDPIVFAKLKDSINDWFISERAVPKRKFQSFSFC